MTQMRFVCTQIKFDGHGIDFSLIVRAYSNDKLNSFHDHVTDSQQASASYVSPRSHRFQRRCTILFISVRCHHLANGHGHALSRWQSIDHIFLCDRLASFRYLFPLPNSGTCFQYRFLVPDVMTRLHGFRRKSPQTTGDYCADMMVYWGRGKWNICRSLFATVLSKKYEQSQKRTEKKGQHG
jgi:hypothetical protein